MNRENEEVLHGYQTLLSNINYCINLMEVLESEDGLATWVSDWYAGDRSTLHIPRTKKHLKILKEEVEKGISIHINLFSLSNKAQIVERSFETSMRALKLDGTHNSRLFEPYNKLSLMNEDNYKTISTADKNIHSIYVYPCPINYESINKESRKAGKVGMIGGGACGGVAGLALGAFGATTASGAVGGGILGSVAAGATLVAATGGTALVAAGGLAAVVGAISYLGQYYYSFYKEEGKERGLKFKEIKLLSDSMEDVKLLNEFQSNNFILAEVAKNLTDEIAFNREELEYFNTFTHQQKVQTGTNSPAKIDDGIQATRIYDKALQQNTQSLRESEPDMSEPMRERSATKLAETECKAFLKYKLNYSDTKVTEFLRKIQS